MRIKLHLLLFLSISLVSYSQVEKEDTLIILDENGFVNSDEKGQLYYLISMKSRDTLFDRDGYNFILNNRRGFEEYASLNEMGEKVSLVTQNYLKITDLAQFSNCELHNFLSLKKEIYVILKNKKNSTYWKYPVLYTGTQKNVEMLKM